MDKNLTLYYESALNLKLPVLYLPDLDCLQIMLGKKYLFMPNITPLNNCTSISLVKNRQIRYELLKAANIPIPKAVTLSRDNFDENLLDSLVQELGFPLVIKPTKESIGGLDVVCNIENRASLYAYLVQNFQKHAFLQVEEFYLGLKEYRILMLNNRVIDVIERLPPEGQFIPFQGKLHRDNVNYLVRTAKAINLDFVGIDVLCDDLSQSFNETKWLIIDVNFDPDISLHEVPDAGKKRSISTQIVKQLIFRHPIAYLFHRIKRLV